MHVMYLYMCKCGRSVLCNKCVNGVSTCVFDLWYMNLTLCLYGMCVTEG